MTKGDIAKNYFLDGYNCSQAVALAFADEMNMEPSFVAKVTSGFGGGVGRMREVCGTVTGMTFVMSALYGYNDPKASTQKAQLYARVQALGEKFKIENGSVVCRELLGLQHNGADSPIPEERTLQYYKKRPCAELVKCSADILEDYINQNK